MVWHGLGVTNGDQYLNSLNGKCKMSETLLGEQINFE